MKKFVVLMLLFMFFSMTALAKEQYVIDVLYVTLREGQGDEFKVIRALKSGTQLETLELGDKGYSLVRTIKGEEGWIKSQYLTDEPVAIIQVEKLRSKNNELVAENSALKQQNAAGKEIVNEAEKESKRLESKNQALHLENEKMKKMSAQPMELARENEAIKAKNKALEAELSGFQEDKLLGFGGASRDWFMTGAGVLLLGIVIGLILPSIRWRKRNSW